MKKLLVIPFLLLATTASAQLRLKTVEYSFAQLTGAAAAGTTSYFTPIGVYIPERTSRTFRSVVSYVLVCDSQTTAASPTAHTVGIGIDAVAFSTANVIATVTNTGEAQNYLYTNDHTAYFNTNFTGSSHTVKMSQMTSTVITNNKSAKLMITYEWDDSDTTRVKTVYIPIQSSTGATMGVLTELGTNQVPALWDYLPENSKVFRDIFFEIYVNEGTGTAVNPDPVMGLALDAEASSDDGSHVDILSSARNYYRIWKRTDMDTTTAHAFKARTSRVNTQFPALGAILVVTYEYDAATSTNVFNSVRIPWGGPSGYIPGPNPTTQYRFTKDLLIDEQDPTIKQSGVILTGADTGTFSIAVATDTLFVQKTTYTIGAYANSGGHSFVRRIDGPGVGYTLSRGSNTIELGINSTSLTSGSRGTMGSAMLYLNYTSSRSYLPGGDANHFHTVMTSGPVFAASGFYTSIAQRVNIPEDNYYLGSDGYFMTTWHGAQSNAMNLETFRVPGADPRNGDYILAPNLYASDAEIGQTIYFADSSKFYDRYPTDPDQERVSIKTFRTTKYDTTGTRHAQFYRLTSYHTSSTTVTGTVSGYTGDGSGITVEAFRSDTNERIITTTTAAGGTFSFIWYNASLPIFGTAYQDSTHKGRSDNIVAGVTAMDISLSAAAASGTRSYPFVQ